MQIIILDGELGNGVDPINIRYALWADVPLARQPYYADSTAGSAFVNATLLELQDIRDGKVYEITRRQQWPPGTTQAQVKSFLEAELASFQTAISGRNEWRYYGTRFNGTIWTVAGVS